MKTLILIDGASGTGKSDLAKYLAKKRHTKIRLLRKTTTREKRPEEENELFSDLSFPPVSKEEFVSLTDDKNFYWYTYGNRQTGENFYGLHRKDILSALEEVDVAIAIIRSLDTIEHIKSQLADIRVVSIFIYTDREFVVKRLREEGYDDESINFRLSRLPLAWDDYTKKATAYDRTIINSSTTRDFELLFDQHFESIISSDNTHLHVEPSSSLALVKPLIGFAPMMEARLREFPYQKNVFLMMKFRSSTKLVYDFIRATLAEHGYNCVRADEPEWDITRNTYNPVAVAYCCKFGIALFDEPEHNNEYSANVAYELGIMHNQLKECLILRHTSLVRTPFDLVKELYVDYSDNLELQGVIRKWVSKLPRL